jgi:uncharacterized protein YggT (Ycf19 family)
MQPTYPNRPDQVSDQPTEPASTVPPDDGLRPTAPVRPRAIEDPAAQPAPVQQVQQVEPGAPVERAPVVTPAGRLAQVIWLVLGIVEALLIMRVVLKALAANPATWFVQFVYGVTAPLVAPFQGIFPTPATKGSVLELSSLVAIVVYALVAWGIVRLIAILDTRQDRSTM